MVITFTLHSGEKLKFKTDKTSLIIGRSPSCDIVLPFENISRQHFKIEFIEGETFITDLGGVNGVFLEGNRIPVSTTVPYNSYLNLAFGSVSAMDIENDAVEDGLTRVTSHTPHHTQPPHKASPASHKEKVKEQRPIPKSSPTAKLNANIFNIVAVLILILGAVYFFYFNEENVIEDTESSGGDVETETI